MKNPQVLLDVAKKVVENPSLQPIVIDGALTTYCNIATEIIADALGYKGFVGLMANQMIDIVTADDNWSFVPLEKAQELVNKGTWIIATERGEAHGHVCTIIPGKTVRAGHWSIQVPICVNIGKRNFIGEGINFAFQDIPKLYAWRETL